ncbi:MAG: hypothetical protein HeimC2_19620, partial [Candidatus Heimdallarchaeota archaeon LC_2]
SLEIVREFEQQGKLANALEELDKIPENPIASLHTAKILNYLGNTKKALSIIQNLISSQNDINDLEFTINLHLLNSDILLSLGDFKQSSLMINNSKKLLESLKKEGSSRFNYWNGKQKLIEGSYSEKKSHFDEAINHYNSAKGIFKKLKDKSEYANSLHHIAEVFEKKGDLSRAMDLYVESLEIRYDLGNEYDISKSLNRIGVVHGKKSEFDTAINYLQQSLNICKEINYKSELAKVYGNLGIISKLRGNLDDAEDYYVSVLKIFTDFGNTENIAKVHINLGDIQMEKGNLDQAISTYNQAIPILDKIDNKMDKANLFNNLGLTHKKKGHFKNALKYYEMSLEYKIDLGQEKLIAPALNNIGTIYLLQGQLNEALENFEKSLKVYESLGYEESRATSLQYIGLIHLEKGNHDLSKRSLLDCLKVRKKIKNNIFISETLYYLIVSTMESNDMDSAQKYFNELQKINLKENHKIIKTRTRLAQAVMLQKDTRINKIVEAQELFEEVLSEDLIDNELTIFAMLKLCEFLLLELKVSGEKEVLVEIKTLLEKLYEMAQEQESHTLLIEILIIQSQLALADYNIKETKEFLQHANEIAEDKELAQYKLKISYLLDRVEKDVIKYANIASTIPINERIDQLAIESYLKEVADHKDLNSFNPEMFKTGLKKNLQMHLNFANLLLMDKTLPEEMKKYVHFIDLSAKEIQFSISTLLMIEKLEAGTYYQNLEDFNLDEIIQLRINNHEEKINAKSLVVDFQKTNGISAVRSDQYLFSRILDHLLDNAIKFANEKSTINIILETDENSRTITVENECDPIPEHEQSNLFDKYTQYLVHESTRKHGVGLGLSFCDHAIKSIKGEIKLISPRLNKETGVSVTIKIPKEI